MTKMWSKIKKLDYILKVNIKGIPLFKMPMAALAVEEELINVCCRSNLQS